MTKCELLDRILGSMITYGLFTVEEPDGNTLNVVQQACRVGTVHERAGISTGNPIYDIVFGGNSFTVMFDVDIPEFERFLSNNFRPLEVIDDAEEITVQYLDDTVTRLSVNAKGDWVDLYAAETVEMKQGDFKLIHLGVAMRLPDGYEAHIVPRSSTYKKWGIIQANHMGVVDNSYSGPNDWWRMTALAMRDTVIEKGDKICQFRIMKRQPSIRFKEGKMEGADRGGFGSTGTK